MNSITKWATTRVCLPPLLYAPSAKTSMHVLHPWRWDVNHQILYLQDVCWFAHSVTSLPGHEGLQHSHVLFGEVVLLNNVLQTVEVAGNHQHRLHLVLTLSSQEDRTEGWTKKKGEKCRKEKCEAYNVMNRSDVLQMFVSEWAACTPLNPNRNVIKWR